nr:transposase [Mycobacteroides abscessus]
MARKNYPDEFKRDAVALYRDTDGATITVIAAELGVSEATLSAWCKAAGVPVRHRKPGSASVPAPGVETPEQELARLRRRGRIPRNHRFGVGRGRLFQGGHKDIQGSGGDDPEDHHRDRQYT